MALYALEFLFALFFSCKEVKNDRNDLTAMNCLSGGHYGFLISLLRMKIIELPIVLYHVK